MKESLLVGLGGFVGAITRFQIGSLSLRYLPPTQFPWATFSINVVGCFLAGLVVAWLERANLNVYFYSREARLLIVIGLLGGFTTFSAFGLETVSLIRTGQTTLALINVLGSVSIGIIALWIGMRVGAYL